MSELLTPLEVSKELKCTRRWVNELLNRGELKGERLGPNWVIRRESLEEYKTKRKKRSKKNQNE